jgi:hypothetical protein
MILKLVNLQTRNLVKYGLRLDKNYALSQKYQTNGNNFLKTRPTNDLIRNTSYFLAISVKSCISTSKNDSNYSRQEQTNVKANYWMIGVFGLVLISSIKTADCESSTYKFVSEKRKFLFAYFTMMQYYS